MKTIFLLVIAIGMMACHRQVKLVSNGQTVPAENIPSEVQVGDTVILEKNINYSYTHDYRVFKGNDTVITSTNYSWLYVKAVVIE